MPRQPKGRHAHVRETTDTARTVSVMLNAVAHVIRAVAVLVDALSEWFK